MQGLTEEELLALDEELERDVIQPNPSYSLRAPTPPPQMSDDDSSHGFTVKLLQKRGTQCTFYCNIF